MSRPKLLIIPWHGFSSCSYLPCWSRIFLSLAIVVDAHSWSSISFNLESSQWSGNSLKLYESQHVCLFCPIRPPLVWVRTGLSRLMNGGNGWQGISFTTLFSYSMEALPKCLSTASVVYCCLTPNACVCVCMCSCEIHTHTDVLKHIINLLWCVECIFVVEPHWLYVLGDCCCPRVGSLSGKAAFCHRKPCDSTMYMAQLSLPRASFELTHVVCLLTFNCIAISGWSVWYAISAFH